MRVMLILLCSFFEESVSLGKHFRSGGKEGVHYVGINKTVGEVFELYF